MICVIGVTTIWDIPLYAQDKPYDYSGKYSYAVVDTPYGDYFGWLFLSRKGKSYQGKIVDEDGTPYQVKAIRVDDNRITFKSTIEEAKTLFICEILSDSIRGTIKVTGDDFRYVLKGIRSDESIISNLESQQIPITK
jgi:hypothetical protein